MKLCPNCRTQNEDDAKFCKECATPFTAEKIKSVDSLQVVQSSAEPADSNCTSMQEDNKHYAPLDCLIEKVSSKFNNSSESSTNQPTLWQKTIDWVKGSGYAIFFLGMIILVFFIIIIGANSSSRELVTMPTSASSASSFVSSEVIPEVVKVSESDIMEVDYSYFVDHFEKYKDSEKYFRIAGQITKASTSYSHSLSFKTIEGNDLKVDFQSACSLAYYEKDMYVTLVGAYYIGNDDSINLINAYIEESGDEAEQTYQRLKAEGDKLRAADAKAEKEKAKKAKKDYIASCKTYKYKDIARNPDKYYGKRAKFKGEVVQVIEGYLDITLRVDVTKGKYGIYTDTMYVVYTPKSSTESRILEDDIITIYGELAGIESYETVMGSKVSIPRIDAEYITINSK